MLIAHLMQCAYRGKEGLARTGLAKTRDERNAFVEQGIHKELLLQVAGADGNTGRRLHKLRQAQSPYKSGPIIPGRHGLAFGRDQQQVFVDGECLRDLSLQLKFTF